MPNPDIYQITLTPVGRFFFGGEVVFGGGENAQDQRRQSYLVHSNLLPQQTSLLGMLREELLRGNGLLKPWSGDAREKDEKRKKALELIGSTGFTFYNGQPPEENAISSFGKIERLSPLVIFRQSKNREQQLQPVPLDDGPFTDNKQAAYVWQGKQQADDAILLANYDPKSELSLHFAAEDPNTDPLELTDLFQQQDQVGITITNRHKWRPGSDDTEGFFRHSSYRNRNSSYADVHKKSASAEKNSFRFWVQVDQLPSTANIWKDGLVQLGGERSTFRMTVEKMQEDFSWPEQGIFQVPYRYNRQAPSKYTRLLLLSDTYLPLAAMKNNGVFAVAGTTSFRFFSTFLEKTDNFYSFQQKVNEQVPNSTFHFQKKYQAAGGRRQSRRYTLLQRGGVLLVPNTNVAAVEDAIKSRTDFRQIGYNYYQTLKSS